ncbi:MAG: 3'-5' exonuclease [Comamonas sp.]
MPRLKPPTKEDSLLLPPFCALPDSAIYVPATPAAFDAARQVLLQQTALGFDTESKPLFQVHQIDTGPHVVQLATPDAAWLLQLHHPQALALAREIVSAHHICKVGFGLDNDKATLPQRLGVAMNHVLDLDRVFKRYGYGSSVGVRAAVALVLGQNFHKSKKQSTSNWAQRQLSEAQIRYAANDAHGPAMVYAALPQWEARQPAPSAPQAPRVRDAQPADPRPTTAPRHKRPTAAALLQAPRRPQAGQEP